MKAAHVFNIAMQVEEVQPLSEELIVGDQNTW